MYRRTARSGSSGVAATYQRIPACGLAVDDYPHHHRLLPPLPRGHRGRCHLPRRCRGADRGCRGRLAVRPGPVARSPAPRRAHRCGCGRGGAAAAGPAVRDRRPIRAARGRGGDPRDRVAGLVARTGRFGCREGPARRWAAVLWAWVALAFCIWELAAYLLGRPSAAAEYAFPPLSDLLDPAVTSPFWRIILVAGWLAGGAALLRRGRHP
jgi:hypothetical protein